MRIVGVNIPDEKNLVIALTYIYGIGNSSAGKILKAANVDGLKKAKELAPEELARIKGIIEGTYKVEGELRQSIKQDINRLKNIKSYRGVRHAKRLPVRGQRTRRNSRTIRGNIRTTAGSGKRKLSLK
jgi:small subunit ribosomal protein S13